MVNIDRIQQKIDDWNNDRAYDGNENYKWRVAKEFHDLIGPTLPSFASRLKEAWKLSENLIDSSNRYCFSALVSCANEH